MPDLQGADLQCFNRLVTCYNVSVFRQVFVYRQAMVKLLGRKEERSTYLQERSETDAGKWEAGSDAAGLWWEGQARGRVGAIEMPAQNK